MRTLVVQYPKILGYSIPKKLGPRAALLRAKSRPITIEALALPKTTEAFLASVGATLAEWERYVEEFNELWRQEFTLERARKRAPPQLLQFPGRPPKAVRKTFTDSTRGPTWHEPIRRSTDSNAIRDKNAETNPNLDPDGLSWHVNLPGDD